MQSLLGLAVLGFEPSLPFDQVRKYDSLSLTYNRVAILKPRICKKNLVHDKGVRLSVIVQSYLEQTLLLACEYNARLSRKSVCLALGRVF